MALTNKEMEAKLAALEERFSLLSQTMDSLEQRLEYAEDRCLGWVVGLRAGLASMRRQMDVLRKHALAPPAK